jgi:peptidyl-prolyl cis-trans isomerase C
MTVKGVMAQGQADTPELRKMIRDNLITREVMLQAAVKNGLDKTSEVAQQIELAKQTALIDAFLQDQLKKNPITETQLQQAFDARKAKLGDKEYSARHILVASEAEARDIIAQLGKKAKFEKLAEKSKDTGSAEHGGLLGWTVPITFVEPFANALLNLRKGEYTKDPVQTQFGWHVIKLDDVRPLKVPSFEEQKPQLTQLLQQQELKKIITDLRASAKIE